MNVLITAGNTQTPLDAVRCITNIFTGKTGARLALEAYDRGHAVRFFTSHPEVIFTLRPHFAPDGTRWILHTYRTFDDLHSLLEQHVPHDALDTIIHCAAVSDYALQGVYVKGAEALHEVSSIGKISGAHPELWLKLVPTPKLIDFMRSTWNYHGILVKFKLEVKKSDEELIAIARTSRQQSQADFLVANTLADYESHAIICDSTDAILPVNREALASTLWNMLEAYQRSATTQ